MAKKKTLKTQGSKKGLFDKFENVKSVRQKESLRFRDTKGRMVKFDARKKLVAEIWLDGKKTNRVLNRTHKGRPIPEKLPSRLTKKRLLFLRNAKQGPRLASIPVSKSISIDSRFTITDNIEAKCPEILDDTIKYTRRGNGSYVTIEITLKKDGESIYEVVNWVLKGHSRSYLSLELARAIIYRLYRNEQRASNMKLSPLGKRGIYVRSFKVRFTWDETKSLKTL